MAQILPAGTTVVVMLGLSGQKEIECAVAIDVDADTFFLGVLMVLLRRYRLPEDAMQIVWRIQTPSGGERIRGLALVESWSSFQCEDAGFYCEGMAVLNHTQCSDEDWSDEQCFICGAPSIDADTLGRCDARAQNCVRCAPCSLCPHCRVKLPSGSAFRCWHMPHIIVSTHAFSVCYRCLEEDELQLLTAWHRLRYEVLIETTCNN